MNEEHSDTLPMPYCLPYCLPLTLFWNSTNSIMVSSDAQEGRGINAKLLQLLGTVLVMGDGLHHALAEHGIFFQVPRGRKLRHNASSTRNIFHFRF